MNYCQTDDLRGQNSKIGAEGKHGQGLVYFLFAKIFDLIDPV